MPIPLRDRQGVPTTKAMIASYWYNCYLQEYLNPSNPSSYVYSFEKARAKAIEESEWLIGSTKIPGY